MRFLQVGLGGFGRNWADWVIPHVAEVEIVGTADLSPTARATAVGEGLVDERTCFADVDEAIAATDPEAVLVTTSLVGHAPISRTALRAGKHVLVEKPFAASVTEAEELVELAQRQGLVLAVSQNYRFFPAVRAAQEIVASGRFGDLHAVELDFRQFSGADGVATPHHGLDEPLLVDMSIHHFDLIRTVLGRDVSTISCRTWDPAWSLFSGPSEGVALIDCADGAGDDIVVSYRASWVSHGPRTNWSGQWRMDFADAEVSWSSRGDGPEGWRADEVRIRQGRTVETLELPVMERTDRRGSLTEFVSAIQQGREATISGRDNIGSLALTYAAVTAARTREPVRLTTG